MHRLISRIEVNIYRIFCDLDRVWRKNKSAPPSETAVKLYAYI